LDHPGGNALIRSGIALFALGAAWELSIYLRGAWPTGLTWIMMVVGMILVAVGCGKKGVRVAYMAWSIVSLFVVILLILWATG